MDDLRSIWNELLSRYTQDADLIANGWAELETAYGQRGRHYHDLAHLQFMFELAEPVQFTDPDMVHFAIFYHDVVYNVKRKDNEERSAALAQERLSTLSVAPERIAHCVRMIEATKSHLVSDDADTTLLLDIDMAILGTAPARYLEYTKQVRAEYAIYPGFLYKRGRKEVLRCFLAEDPIFKTPAFKKRFEAQARTNIMAELLVL